MFVNICTLDAFDFHRRRRTRKQSAVPCEYPDRRPIDGLGSRLDRIKSWLDENCGAFGWAMTPSGTRGVLNDALSI
jgi:hypothetical protein